jgi:hypothetical protein
MVRKDPESRGPLRLVATVTEQEYSDFRSACVKVGVDPAYTIRNLAAAFTAHVDAHGRVVQPIALTGPAEIKK